MASPYDPVATDPPLLERSSEIKTYTTSKFTYPGLRVFYRRHQQADRLPKSPAPIPLLVFIHGLGGSVAQFHPLLTSLTSVASCLAIDLPGCGRSEFSVRSWEAYTTDALVELLETIIEDYREKEDGQGVVLIGHSMGASLAALLASPRLPPQTSLNKHVVGLIAICPSSGLPSQKQITIFRALLWIPEFIFNFWRAWDRRGGSGSTSVNRFVGADADSEAKRLQDLYNNQSNTSVWRRMAWGCLPTYVNGVAQGGMPSKETWEKLNVPVFLVGGENDKVTPPREVAKVCDFLEDVKTISDTISPGTSVLADSAAPVDIVAAGSKIDAMTSLGQGHEDTRGCADQEPAHKTRVAEPEEGADDPVTPTEQAASLPSLSLHPEKVVRSIIMGKPATHALLYTPSTVRILAGLISDFMVVHITGRLALGWQLQYLSQDGKWDVKNLRKWQAVEPVSEPIGGIFRAIKTLREVDEDHSPSEFVKKWVGSSRTSSTFRTTTRFTTLRASRREEYITTSSQRCPRSRLRMRRSRASLRLLTRSAPNKRNGRRERTGERSTMLESIAITASTERDFSSSVTLLSDAAIPRRRLLSILLRAGPRASSMLISRTGSMSGTLV
ncbi:unnamed protein product [Sordaria macrospora k-hell]|uniref:WGS project CABT00000000 data, contig 2.5 n=1 Tax=Sordaria macrospora (strain ATCC MYA-333 / DSM 997 / K(L3346) / K-hell) TaxID=771870 RepID=F7VSC0_SORMK|nr:uncharacterized protein SMAC_01950 [Sordaria macrospora k-hell]CCC08406.1 unnamed protein product [Sordaria macrospora k-hell]